MATARELGEYQNLASDGLFNIFAEDQFVEFRPVKRGTVNRLCGSDYYAVDARTGEQFDIVDSDSEDESQFKVQYNHSEEWFILVKR